MKLLLISILLVGLAMGAKLKSKQEIPISMNKCMEASEGNSTACDEIVACQLNQADCDFIAWNMLQIHAAMCYKVEQPDWDGTIADASNVPDLVACMWESFCEQMLGQTPGWCRTQWADNHHEAEAHVDSIVLAKVKSRGSVNDAMSVLDLIGSICEIFLFFL